MEYHLAQVAYEVHVFRQLFVSWATSGKGVSGDIAKFDEFLIKFKNGTEGVAKAPESSAETELDYEARLAKEELEKQSATINAKMAFAGLMVGKLKGGKAPTRGQKLVKRKQAEIAAAEAGKVPVPPPAAPRPGRNAQRRK